MKTLTLSRNVILRSMYIGPTKATYAAIFKFLDAAGIKAVEGRLKGSIAYPAYLITGAVKREFLEYMRKNSNYPHSIGVPHIRNKNKNKNYGNGRDKEDSEPIFDLSMFDRIPVAPHPTTPTTIQVEDVRGILFTIQYGTNKAITVTVEEARQIHRWLEDLWKGLR
jgi:hypothetical protein